MVIKKLLPSARNWANWKKQRCEFCQIKNQVAAGRGSIFYPTEVACKSERQDLFCRKKKQLHSYASGQSSTRLSAHEG